MERSNAIQGWRGIAILMVFLSHTRTFLSPNLALFSDFGEKGVYIFIAISGILLCKNSLVKDYSGDLRDGFRYAVNKVRRLYPLHFVLWMIMFFATTTKENLKRNIIFSIFNISLTQSFIPFSGIINSFNGPSWYLSMCLFLWILTPVFIKYVNYYHLKDIAGKLFLACALIWGIWLNIGNLFLEFVASMSYRINPSWFERWLLYSCPLLDFIIYIMAFWGYEYFSQKKDKSVLLIFISFCLIIVSIVLKGNIPILYNIPFFMAIIIIIGHTLNYKDSIITKIIICRPLVYIGNLSSYFFLIHGVINLLIVRTELKNLHPWIFFISFTISLSISSMIYFAEKFHKRSLKTKLS